MTAKPKKLKGTSKGTPYVWLGLVILATFISMFPTLKNEFVNWDDIIYVMNNDLIKSFSTDNLWKIFSSFYMGNYHPLPILSFSFDYALFEMDPFGYHLHNLILHLVNVILVYYFVWLVLGKQMIPALFVALLFGIHPMHVESVAWISERKDLLYTAWFLIGLITYLFYIKTSKKKYYFWTLAAFLFSLLSKAQAVTFPLVLLLLDYIFSRKFTRMAILEKIPFFLLSLIFGLIAIFAQEADNALNPVGVTWIEALFFGQYSFVVYIFKFLFPVHLSALHGYPLTAEGSAPYYIYLSTLIFIIAAFVIYKTWQTRKYVAFGILFFLFTIFPVLQFLPVGQAIVAERYTYIPYIGLSILAVSLIFDLSKRIVSKNTRYFLDFLFIAALFVFMVVTWERSKTWKDSDALWTDVIEKYPETVSAYVNRGYIYNQYNRYTEAIRDCETGIQLDPDNYKLYMNRAISYKRLNQYELAIADFSTTFLKNPDDFQPYLEKGIIYTDKLSKYDSGVINFRIFLKYNPDHPSGNFNLGVAYFKQGAYDSAWVYCVKAIDLNPKMSTPYYILAVIQAQQNNFTQAYNNGLKARSLGFSVNEKQLSDWKNRSGKERSSD